MEFTLLEKQAITKIILDLANVDGEVSDEEVHYIEVLKKHLNTSWEEMIKGTKLNYTKSITVIQDMDNIKKNAFALMMSEMIAADGIRDQKEMKIFLSVIKEAGIHLPDFNN